MSEFNRDFIYTVPHTVLMDPNMSLLDLKVYMIIRSFMDTTGDAYPTNGWIATRLRVHPVSVSRSISYLVRKDYILRFEDDDGYRHLTVGRPVPQSVAFEDSPPELVDEGLTEMFRGGKQNCLGGVNKIVNQLDQRDITSKCEKELRKISKNEIQTIFETIWELYPIKKAKQKAIEQLILILRNLGRAEAENFAKRIWEGLNANLLEHNTKLSLKSQGADIWIPEFPYLGKWLAERRWEDKYISPDELLKSATLKSTMLNISTMFN